MSDESCAASVRSSARACMLVPASVACVSLTPMVVVSASALSVVKPEPCSRGTAQTETHSRQSWRVSLPASVVRPPRSACCARFVD
jgi:hypothetical protein